MKVYIVKVIEPCEHDQLCDCIEYSIDGVFLSKEKAENRAKQLHGDVWDYEIEE